MTRFGLSLVAVLAAALVATGPVAPRAPAAARFSHSEHKLIRLVNDVRARNGLGALRVSAALGSAAERHTRDMLKRDFFDHASSDGTSFARRLRGHTNARADRRDDRRDAARRGGAATIVQLWMQSPPHRAVVLGSGFHRVGLGRRWGTLCAPTGVRRHRRLRLTSLRQARPAGGPARHYGSQSVVRPISSHPLAPTRRWTSPPRPRQTLLLHARSPASRREQHDRRLVASPGGRVTPSPRRRGAADADRPPAPMAFDLDADETRPGARAPARDAVLDRRGRRRLRLGGRGLGLDAGWSCRRAGRGARCGARRAARVAPSAVAPGSAAQPPCSGALSRG